MLTMRQPGKGNIKLVHKVQNTVLSELYNQLIPAEGIMYIHVDL